MELGITALLKVKLLKKSAKLLEKFASELLSTSSCPQTHLQEAKAHEQESFVFGPHASSTSATLFENA